MSEAIGRLISLALRSGIKVDNIIEQLQGIRGSQPVWQNGELILSCPDGIGKALKRYVERRNTLTLMWQEKEKADDSMANNNVKEKSEQPELIKTDDQEIKIQNKIDLDHHIGLGHLCPRCSIQMVRAEGCYVCQSCGYSKCG
jgi:ribonucleoside-diphosphate reductase alpha chain